jgi:hypothetical protein
MNGLGIVHVTQAHGRGSNGVKIMEQHGDGTTSSECDRVSGFYNSSAPANRIFVPIVRFCGPLANLFIARRQLLRA